jgi:hypothetical protein
MLTRTDKNRENQRHSSAKRGSKGGVQSATIPLENNRRDNILLNDLMMMANLPVQRIKGDKDDPHEAKESKPIWLPKVTDAVIVPGLAGCAAMKINVFQHLQDEKRLVTSVVFHSEGKVDRTMVQAHNINARIIREAKDLQISVEILVMYNGNHKPAESDHGPVLEAITKDFGKEIPHNVRTEIIKSSEDFINVDMSGTEGDILENYKGKLHVPAPQEVVDYRIKRFPETRNKMAGKLKNEELLKRWTYQWGQTETIEQVDELIQEANNPVKKKETGGGCYLTSACVEYAGLGDDCHELTVLRRFRDTYMSGLKEGPGMIREYYSIAPGIVKAINNSHIKDQLYAEIFKIIRQCVSEIENFRMNNALLIYKNMVERLMNLKY